MINDLKVQAILNWLASGAPPQTDFSASMGELCSRLAEAGLEADFVSFHQRPRNPLFGGTRVIWRPGRNVDFRAFSHAEMQSPYYIGGIVDRADADGRLIRYRPGASPEFDDHPGSLPIRKMGVAEYVAIPLITTTGTSALFSVAVNNPEGLSDDQLALCRRIAAPLARIVQSHVLETTANDLLATYLGRDAGARVSAGMMKRGDADMIRAVILFTDITGFTALSNQLPIAETISLLNRYFEALETPFIKNGGEVLKLMGDGMLAIFPTPDDLTAEEGAALSALSAVEDARRTLAGDIFFRTAYHIGEIHYGNIGGRERLDFTAIGPAVNLTARLLDAVSRLDKSATCSAAFARLIPDRATDLGMMDFKGFKDRQQVFSIS